MLRGCVERGILTGSGEFRSSPSLFSRAGVQADLLMNGRLLWNRGLRAELGTVAIQQQLEAFLDQPKIRPLVKRLNILLNNTAIGSDARAERLVETKMHVEDIAERLGELKELKFVATKNARDLADLLDDAIYPDLTQLFPHLTKLTFASHPVGSGPATETGHLNVCATTLVNQMHWWSSLYSFTSMGVLYEHIPDGVVPLPLTHLVFGVKEEVSPMLDYFLASTKATLTSFTLATKDALIVEVLSTLCAPDWHLKRLSVAAKSPSTLFNVGIPEGAPNYTIFEAFTPVLVALPTLEVLILGHNNAPDQPRLDLNAISFWGHSLDIPEFWAALPSTLTTLGIGCIAGRRAKGMMDYLTREEGQRAPLRLLKFRASEGRAVGFRCEELGIRFGECCVLP